jgi:arginyl-tRNA synthetase
VKEEIQLTLKRAFEDWLREQPAELREAVFAVSVEAPPGNVPADSATSLPLAVAKRAKRPPRQVAEEILARLPAGGDLIEKAEVSGAGFLNFVVSARWLTGELRAILTKRETYARRVPSGGDRVLLEFVSANPNGPLHVGHGRGAALGDSLARILRHLGHEVVTEYYVNNMGNQMENLGASVMGRCREADPAYLDAAESAAVDARPPEDLYRGDYLKDVAKDVMARFPKGSDRPRGLEFFKKLAIGEVLQMIQRDLAAFRVSFDGWFPESQLHESGKVDEALAALRANGHLEDRDGALWFLSTKFGDDKDRVIKRQDERPTYFASDIAYHAEKYGRGFRRMIDIWGTDHHGYVRRVKAAVEALGRDPERLHILLYQLVTLLREGKPVAMSTRSGDYVTLREVMDEVGADACRFFYALRSPNSHLEFDLDLAKKQAPENPVFYVQYVHARCCSLFREAEKRGVPTDRLAEFPAPERLEPAERALLLRLASYPDVVQQCGRDLTPHHITTYLMGLAGEYHRFYESCRVLGEARETTAFRLALADGVRTIIKNGLSLLGVTAPDAM